LVPKVEALHWNPKPSLPLARIEARGEEFLMKSKSLNDGVERTFVLILDQGEEAFKTITDFANREKITGASVSAIGAFSKAKVGWFDLSAKRYKPIDVTEQCEVLSLIGDVAQGDDGNASLHLHAVLGLQDGTVRGGHFLSGSVQPTLEVTITESVVHLRRKKRADLGIALISV
jgi:predicted DNA-binding protein with PD1-like motif